MAFTSDVEHSGSSSYPKYRPRVTLTGARSITLRSLQAPSAEMVASAFASQRAAPPVSEATPPLSRPSHAGTFELLQCIGRGKSGAVWRARHPRLARDVAIKLLRDDLDHDEAARRLMHEANVIARVGADCVAHAYDLGRDEAGRPYLVLQLFEGRTLARVLAGRTPLGAERAARLVRSVGRALHEIHASRVVHGDLKAEDIFLLRAPGLATRVKIVDFGEGRLLDAEPEAGGAADARDDVLALGVLAYRALTGRTPQLPHLPWRARAASPAPARRSPLPSHYDASTPRAVDAVLAKALALDPSDRFSSVRELTEALTAASVRARTVAEPRAVVTAAPEAAAIALPACEPRRDATPTAMPWRRAGVLLAVFAAAFLSASVAARAWPSRGTPSVAGGVVNAR